MILGLDHIQLAMPAGREDEARSFYCNLLGLNEIEKPKPLQSRGGCWFQGEGIQVHLGVEKEFQPARKAHPCFLVKDPAALRERLVQAGISTLPDDTIAGINRFYASDPFGNRLEFLQDGQGFSQKEH